MQTVSANTHYEAVQALKAMLRGRTPALSHRHLVIAPDIYTFTLEKELFLDSDGAFDIEVTTFNRLYMRLVRGAGVLPKKGAVMLIKKLALARKKELTCFSRSARTAGFALKLYETFSAFLSCGITPEALSFPDSLRYKLTDIQTLYADYLKETAGAYTDAAGRLSALDRFFRREPYLQNCRVYFVLFERSSPVQRLLFEAMDRSAAGCCVFEAAEHAGYRTGGAVELLSVPDAVTQLKEAAVRIRARAVQGIRYDEMCIVDEGADYEAARRILTEFDIPFYMETRLNLKNTELVRFLLAAAGFCFGGFARADALALVKNRYLKIDKADADAFENLSLMRGIEYKGFFTPFAAADAPDAAPTAAAAERARTALLDAVSPLSGVGQRTDAAAVSAAFYRLMERADCAAMADAPEPTDDRRLDQVYDKVCRTLDLFAALFTDPQDRASLLETLEEGFNSEQVAHIPVLSDTVKLGGLDSFRGQRFRFAVILNCNEGVLPVLSPDTGLLSDADIDKMRACKVSLEPKCAEKNRVGQKVLKDFLRIQPDLFISYIKSEGQRPSYALKLLEPGGAYRADDYFDRRFALLEGEYGIAETAQAYSAPLHALEQWILRPDSPHAASLNRALRGYYDPDAVFSPTEPPAPLTDAARLFFPAHTTSVSALQTYFECPARYFYRYGLGLKERDTGEMTPVDFGNVLHGIVERFVGGECRGAEAEIARLLENEIEKNPLLAYRLSGKVKADLLAEAVTLCGVVKRQLNAGAFVPLAAEISFGQPGDALKTLDVGTPDCPVRLIGKIDRVDTANGFARVIDYKTGATKFEYADLFYGRKLQLAVYMRILIENGCRPAGFFYLPFSVSWQDDAFSHRLSGPFNGDPSALVDMDAALIAGGKSSVIECTVRLGKDGGLSIAGVNKKGCSEAQLDAIADYARAASAGAVKEILSGVLPAYPYKKSDGHGACGYCPYFSACAHGGGARLLSAASRETLEQAMAAQRAGTPPEKDLAEAAGGSRPAADGEGAW
ncbi:MAG: PD-(D/E)XK nuclease family protein [Clostridiales bacterium]|jgi:ATP-dependent helicase/nuclease subunit B|nr:PD-(D/E)XK nuclease family protein [Clostridiales bacterium]